MGNTASKLTLKITIEDKLTHLNMTDFVGNNVMVTDGGWPQVLGKVVSHVTPTKGELTLEIEPDEELTASISVLAISNMSLKEYRYETFYFESN